MPEMPPLILQHPTPNPAWLARLTEDVLEPDLPIVDPHHHLWDHGRQQVFAGSVAGRSWQRPQHRRNGVPPVLLGLSHAAGRRRCGRSARPNSSLRSPPRPTAAKRTPMSAPASSATRTSRLGEQVDAVLEAHIAAGGGRFRGIRHITARHPTVPGQHVNAARLRADGDPAFRAGFARLGAHGLSYDAWLYHTQIDQMTDLARAFPETPIVLNHVGGPLGVGPYRGKTRGGVRRVASCA